MKDILERKIVETSAYGMSVVRTRNSDGYSEIAVRVGDTIIKFDSEVHGSTYEDQATTLAHMIDSVASNMCLLPDTSK